MVGQVPGEASLPVLHTATFLCPHMASALCAEMKLTGGIFSVCKDISPISLGPQSHTSFNTSLKTVSLNGVTLGLGLVRKHRGGEGCSLCDIRPLSSKLCHLAGC
jgi:hypothetical protein